MEKVNADRIAAREKEWADDRAKGFGATKRDGDIAYWAKAHADAVAKSQSTHTEAEAWTAGLEAKLPIIEGKNNAPILQTTSV